MSVSTRTSVAHNSYESVGTQQLLRGYLNGPVVVTMVAVWVVQVALHQVVGVIAVGHRLVSAAGAVDMARLVPTTIVQWSTDSRIDAVDRQGVLVDVPKVRMMQMPFMKVIGMAFVYDGRMTTTGTMHVIVAGMYLAWRWSDFIRHARISNPRGYRWKRFPRADYSAYTLPVDAPAEPRVGCMT